MSRWRNYGVFRNAVIGLGAIGLIALVAVGCGDDDENGPTGSSLRAVL
ncbi:hypothetical protein GF420_14725, partial [candidate division GN15 bacterium]|nr:hypothetical protein [candidate division GN15 bacterium]